ncbi:MAG: methyltransferase [Hyphomicrobiaceae bacterium]
MTEKLLETAEELSRVAFGFMASKALFAGLHIDLFSQLSTGAKAIPEIAKQTKVPVNRITTLVTALNAIGALDKQGETYANSPAAEHFLVKGARYDFGDYLRYQIDKQMYPFLLQLNHVMDGTLNPDAVDSYERWMNDSGEASLYSESQHAGSLGPGRTLARVVDLSKSKSLLDIGGGTGAMTISLCNAYPDLNATIIDFPNVAEIGWRFITEANLINRVRYIPGNALEAQWPTEQDSALMSYLLSGVPGERIPELFARAYESLSPGGILMVHDFMVEADRTGPALAALWQLQHLAFTPSARSLSAEWLSDAMTKAGFTNVERQELIPGMTKLVTGQRAA